MAVVDGVRSVVDVGSFGAVVVSVLSVAVLQAGCVVSVRGCNRAVSESVWTVELRQVFRVSRESSTGVDSAPGSGGGMSSSECVCDPDVLK